MKNEEGGGGGSMVTLPLFLASLKTVGRCPVDRDGCDEDNEADSATVDRCVTHCFYLLLAVLDRIGCYTNDGRSDDHRIQNETKYCCNLILFRHVLTSFSQR